MLSCCGWARIFRPLLSSLVFYFVVFWIILLIGGHWGMFVMNDCGNKTCHAAEKTLFIITNTTSLGKTLMEIGQSDCTIHQWLQSECIASSPRCLLWNQLCIITVVFYEGAASLQLKLSTLWPEDLKVLLSPSLRSQELQCAPREQWPLLVGHGRGVRVYECVCVQVCVQIQASDN